MEPKELVLLRTDNRIAVSPTTPRVRSLLAPKLTFVRRIGLQGLERRLARRRGAPLVIEEDAEVFLFDHRQRINTTYGFFDLIVNTLTEAGYSLRYDNLTPPAHPERFIPDWDRVFSRGIELRTRQDEMLVAMAEHDNGRFGCPPGYGKTFCIGVAGHMWPKLRIAVMADSATVIRDRIYPELVGMHPSVGIVGGGRKVRGRRIMCYTFDSLHWLLHDSDEYGPYDIIFCDEVHQAPTDAATKNMVQIPGQPRMFGLSATQDMRWDGLDYRVQALFGPLRISISYQEALADGLVAEVDVKVRRVVLDQNPVEGCRDDDRLRLGIWRNDYRNDLILLDALSYWPDQQVMISCTVLEHLLALRQRLDELKRLGLAPEKAEIVCVYSEQESDQIYHEKVRKFQRRDLDLTSMPRMDVERRQRLTKQIEYGQVPLFACTTVFNVGFDPKKLEVVCRADGTSNPIADYQIPGRGTRRNDFKQHCTVHDYLDCFDKGFKTRAERRLDHYQFHGWTVTKLPDHTGALAERMGWAEAS